MCVCFPNVSDRNSSTPHLPGLFIIWSSYRRKTRQANESIFRSFSFETHLFRNLITRSPDFWERLIYETRQVCTSLLICTPVRPSLAPGSDLLSSPTTRILSNLFFFLIITCPTCVLSEKFSVIFGGPHADSLSSSRKAHSCPLRGAHRRPAAPETTGTYCTVMHLKLSQFLYRTCLLCFRCK